MAVQRKQLSGIKDDIDEPTSCTGLMGRFDTFHRYFCDGDLLDAPIKSRFSCAVERAFFHFM